MKSAEVVVGIIIGAIAGLILSRKVREKLHLDAAAAERVEHVVGKTKSGIIKSFRDAAFAVMELQKRFRQLENVNVSPMLKNLQAHRHDESATDEVKKTRSTRPARVLTIALTGGPCGGKTSSLNSFAAQLRALHYDVYTGAEVPTILINGGCVYPGNDSDTVVPFESALVSLQIQLEDSLTEIAASTGRNVVIVFDRGVIDAKAYLPDELWHKTLASKGWDEKSLLDRYDMVLHLVTAADGAEQHYTTANNTARRETAAEARALDMKIRSAWKDHPKLVVIGNDPSGSFQAKLDAANEAVLSLVKQ